jgi:MFS family permease
LGTFGAITGLAIISGPVVGGAIAQGIDWTWIFWINLPIGLVIIPLGIALLKESRGGDARIDGLGVLLMVGAAFGVTWALMRTSELGWGGGEVLLSFGAAVLLTIGFIVWQHVARAPMLPPRLFAHRAFSAGVSATFLHYGALYATLFFIAQFLQVSQGFSPLDAGLRILPWTATLFFVAPIAGNLLNRTGERPLVLAGLLLQAFGLGTIALTAGPEMSFFSLAIPQIIAGAGASLAIPSMQSAVMGAVSEKEMGKATGAFGVAEFLGGVAGVALASSVFAASGSFATQDAFSTGFSNAMWVAAALSFLGGMAAIFLPSRSNVREVQPVTP